MLDVITCAIFGDYRSRVGSLVTQSICPLPLTWGMPYNAAHTIVWPCDLSTQNFSTNLWRLGHWTDFDMRYISGRVGYSRSAFLGVKAHYFHLFIISSKLPKILFWDTYNANSMANTHLHNSTVYRATTLKLDKLFDLVKYLDHT